MSDQISIKNPINIWFTDFDGTIRPHTGQVSEPDRTALKILGQKGIIRVVATGRSLFAFAKDYDYQTELDYLIFSSGLGLCSWNNMGPGPMLSTFALSKNEAALAITAALELGYGFFAYAPPPDSHHFLHQPPLGPAPTGYSTRLDIYRSMAKPFISIEKSGPLGQLLIMVPEAKMPETKKRFEELAPGLSLTLSSSPFEDNCLWLEIYPPKISKGQIADNLAKRLGLLPSMALAMGNDFNDEDLLAWAGRAFITEDAPDSLKSRFHPIPNAFNSPLNHILNNLNQNPAFGLKQN